MNPACLPCLQPFSLQFIYSRKYSVTCDQTLLVKKTKTDSLHRPSGSLLVLPDLMFWKCKDIPQPVEVTQMTRSMLKASFHF